MGVASRAESAHSPGVSRATATMDYPQTLTAEEIDLSRQTFLRFDTDRSGSIDLWELRNVLECASAAFGP